MLRLLTPAFGLLMLVGIVGCQQDKSMDDPKMMSETDVCPTCRGVQRATTDGKCEMCGVAVADACPHCAGTQVATAEGKCPSCGARVGNPGK